MHRAAAVSYTHLTGCEKDAEGNVTAVLAEVYLDSKTGMEGSNRKVKATIHWVSTAYALDAEVRLYDRLFLEEDPSGIPAEELKDHLNPDSLIVQHAYAEECLRCLLYTSGWTSTAQIRLRLRRSSSVSYSHT